MNSIEILSESSFLPYEKPSKLIFMLHGYGDTAENFIHIADAIKYPELKANYIALDGSSSIPNYPIGKRWFDLYPNGIYITEAGIKEIAITRLEVSNTLVLIKNSIKKTKNLYNLSFKDCFLLGFSQGGMITFEFGNYFKEVLGGLAILSGRVMPQQDILNENLLDTPIFISHGVLDEVIPIRAFEKSCKYLKKNKIKYESHRIDGDGHTISHEVINLFQKFIKKNL